MKTRSALSARPAMPPPKPIVRGYDSSELLLKDSLIRIRKFEAEIAAEAEKKN